MVDARPDLSPDSDPGPAKAPARPLAVVILAAGAGTRMRSDLPKVLHEVAGRSLLAHALASAEAAGPARTVLVVGHGGETVADAARAMAPAIRICEQAERLGTAHAVSMARGALDGFVGDLLVLYADTPFIRPETIARLRAAMGDAALAVLGFEADEPGGYGRLILDEGMRLARIVEAKDASDAERAVTACNSGVMIGDAQTILRLLDRVGTDNAQGEYYLTDLPAIAGREGLRTVAVFCPEEETMGVNARADLARAEAVFQTRARAHAMAAGATLIAPETVFFAHDTELGRDVIVEPNVFFGPGVSVEEGARILAFCHLAEVRIGRGATVGPFARIRGGAEIGPDVRVGNFVEIKKSRFGPGAKAAHLAYLGDATIGAGANIGAGVVTCNYDGVDKHETRIEAGAFVGTNASLVAPLTVGEGAYIATGTVVTEDVPADALAIARPRQTTREGFASRLRKTFAARKAAKKKAAVETRADRSEEGG